MPVTGITVTSLGSADRSSSARYSAVAMNRQKTIGRFPDWIRLFRIGTTFINFGSPLPWSFSAARASSRSRARSGEGDVGSSSSSVVSEPATTSGISVSSSTSSSRTRGRLIVSTSSNVSAPIARSLLRRWPRRPRG